MTAITSFAEARALLFAALDVDVVHSAPGVTQVFDHDPRAVETVRPAIVTIFATGFDPQEWLFTFAIRVYYDTKVSSQSVAQHGLDVIVEAVDEAVALAGRLGPVNWTIGEADNIAALVAQSDVTIGREGF